jgi:hypothetical protein
MKRRLLVLDVSGCDFGVAHVFEHLFIRGFEDFLEERGVICGLWGWCIGETFRDVIFMDCGFYADGVNELFDDYVGAKKMFAEDSIREEVERIGAEDEKRMVFDMTKLKGELRRIEALRWVDLDKNKVVKYFEKNNRGGNQIIAAKKGGEFVNFSIVVMLGLGGQRINAQLYLRMTPIIMDNVTRAAYEFGAYEVDDCPLAEKDGRLYSIISYRVRADKYDVMAIKSAVRDRLRGVDFSKHEDDVAKYIAAFRDDPAWTDFPIGLFRHAGFLISRGEIADVFGPRRIQQVWDKLEFRVRKD